MSKAIVLSMAALACTGMVAQGSRTVKDGVYSDAQAAAGQKLYVVQCQQCHGDDLLGNGPFPAVVGDGFVKEWAGQPVSDLFDRMSRTMPASQPGSLKPDQNAAILAYILKANGFRAGKADLPADSSALGAIRF